MGGTLIGFVVAALFTHQFLSRTLAHHLSDQVDEELKTRILNITSFLSHLGPPFDWEKVQQELERQGHIHGIDKNWFFLYQKDGELVAHSNLDYWERVQQPAGGEFDSQLFSFHTLRSQNAEQEVRTVSLNQGEGYRLEVALDLSDSRALHSKGSRVFGIALVFVVSLGSFLGWLATRRPIAGIQSVAQAAVEITESSSFKQRVTSPTGTLETDQLTGAFNAMVIKIQSLIQAQKDMMDHIAHDIRSPVARMRARAEMDLLEENGGSVNGQVIEDCDQILNLINTLLTISATEAGIVNWEIMKFDLSKTIGIAMELFAPVIEQKELQLVSKIEPELFVAWDEPVAQRVLSNFIDNAIKFTPPGGTITVEAGKLGETVSIHISDTGVGVSRDDLPQLFDRFFRCDSSRTQPGSGLGLSFCKAAITAMKGKICCESDIGKGSRFVITLPAAT